MDRVDGPTPGAALIEGSTSADAAGASDVLPVVRLRMTGLLRAYTAQVPPSYVEHLPAAAALRRANPTLSPTEVALLDDAVGLAADR